MLLYIDVCFLSMVILYIIPFFIHKSQEKTDFEQSRNLPPLPGFYTCLPVYRFIQQTFLYAAQHEHPVKSAHAVQISLCSALSAQVYFTRAIVSLAIASSSLVGTTNTLTLESGVEISLSTPLQLLSSSSMATPR